VHIQKIAVIPILQNRLYRYNQNKGPTCWEENPRYNRARSRATLAVIAYARYCEKMQVRLYLSFAKFRVIGITEKGGKEMANKRAKAVSFNLDNKEEHLMWKYVSKRNFSGYVKKLILEDMKRKATEKAKEQPKTTPKPFIPSK
jgi:hypothetical protein